MVIAAHLRGEDGEDVDPDEKQEPDPAEGLNRLHQASADQPELLEHPEQANLAEEK